MPCHLSRNRHRLGAAPVLSALPSPPPLVQINLHPPHALACNRPPAPPTPTLTTARLLPEAGEPWRRNCRSGRWRRSGRARWRGSRRWCFRFWRCACARAQSGQNRDCTMRCSPTAPTTFTLTCASTKPPRQPSGLPRLVTAPSSASSSSTPVQVSMVGGARRFPPARIDFRRNNLISSSGCLPEIYHAGFLCFAAPGCCHVGQRVGWGGFAVPFSYDLTS